MQSATRTKPASPGLVYLKAAVAAMPRTIGDRERIAAMHNITQLAIRCRFVFDKHDGKSLADFGISTCVGIYRPLDHYYYTQACIHGGTYARMCETHTGLKPWIARRAITPERYDAQSKTLDNNRVAETMGILVPRTDRPEDLPDLARFEDAQVWWCTTLSNETLVLCRYRVVRGENPFERNGKPAKRWVVSRGDWAELMQSDSGADHAD